MLYQRQVVRHSQGKAGDLFQDIARYLQVQDNTQYYLHTQYYLPVQKSLSRSISLSLQEAALGNAKGHSQGQRRTVVFKVSYLRCDLVLIKVRKVLELCKDIFCCWECFWLALFPLLAFLSTYQSWEDQKTVVGYLPHERRTRHQPSARASPSARPVPVMQHSQKAGVPDLKLIRTILNSKQQIAKEGIPNLRRTAGLAPSLYQVKILFEGENTFMIQRYIDSQMRTDVLDLRCSASNFFVRAPHLLKNHLAITFQVAFQKSD